MHDPVYIKWMQRALNREVRRGLAVNGVPDEPYREAVATFKRINSIRELNLTERQVGRKCQDKLIYASHASPDYSAWLRLVIPNSPPPARGVNRVDQELVKAVKKFQSRNGLDGDGWVGHKTEQKLIDLTGKTPPGTRPGDMGNGGGGKPDLKDPFVVNWNSLSRDQRYLHMCKRTVAEIITDIVTVGTYGKKLLDMAAELATPQSNGAPKDFGVFLWDDIENLKKPSVAKTIDRNRQIYPQIMKHTTSIRKYLDRYSDTVVSSAHYERNYANHFQRTRHLFQQICIGMDDAMKYSEESEKYPAAALVGTFISTLSETDWHIYRLFTFHELLRD